MCKSVPQHRQVEKMLKEAMSDVSSGRIIRRCPELGCEWYSGSYQDIVDTFWSVVESVMHHQVSPTSAKASDLVDDCTDQVLENSLMDFFEVTLTDHPPIDCFPTDDDDDDDDDDDVSADQRLQNAHNQTCFVTRTELWKAYKQWLDAHPTIPVRSKSVQFFKYAKEYMFSCGIPYSEDTTICGVRVYHVWRGYRIKTATDFT
jgi:hypothetical protein